MIKKNEGEKKCTGMKAKMRGEVEQEAADNQIKMMFQISGKKTFIFLNLTTFSPGYKKN